MTQANWIYWVDWAKLKLTPEDGLARLTLPPTRVYPAAAQLEPCQAVTLPPG